MRGNGRTRRLFITGATGFIGRHLVTHALARGHPLTVLVRDPARADFPPGVLTMVSGDLLDESALRVGARGAEAAIHLAAVTRTADPILHHRVNVDGTRALIAACRAEGVRRIVAVSSLSVRNAVVGPYGATKREMERVLLESGLEPVILRPGLVYGPGELGLFYRTTRLLETLPIVPIIGGGRSPIRPIHVRDLVEAILQCLVSPHVVGRCYDIVGPDELSFREFLWRVGRALGQAKRQVHLPVPVARVAARAMARVHRDPPITMDNVIGADQVTPCDPEPARRDLSLRPIPLREGLRTIRDPMPQPGTPGDRPIRIAIVGLGKMGVSHTALFSRIPGARVAALVDVNPRLGAIVRGMGFRAPFFPSLAEAITETGPDGVVIATPNHTHAPLARLAAAHRVGVLIEKPLAESLDAAMDIASSLAEAGVPASCGYTLAYLPTFEKVKDLLDSGALGRVHGFQASMFLSEVFAARAGWRYASATAGGGVLPNLASHLLFLLHWFFGDVERVEATTESLFTQVDDAAHIRLAFTNGVAGTVETSWSLEGYPMSVTTVTVEGEHGRLVANDEEISLVLARQAGGLPEGESRIHAADLPQQALYDIGGEAYFKEDADFVAALRTGQPVRTSIARAVHVQAMLEAIFRSAAQGGAVKPLQPVSLPAMMVAT
jgi:predicted dehydrogenase/nucleoside-diphosphate-sugar epimerase